MDNLNEFYACQSLAKLKTSACIYDYCLAKLGLIPRKDQQDPFKIKTFVYVNQDSAKEYMLSYVFE